MRNIGIAALGALLCLTVPAKAELLVNISKSQQRLSVTIDGAEAYRWPVSTGRRGHATPAGKFRPTRLERHWYSHQYGMTPMPWAVFFHRGYAVHGTMEAYNLGHAASHGCVRLRPDNASILFSLVRQEGAQNTKFVVMNGPLPAPPGAAPMAAADARPAPAAAEQHFAQASDDDDLQKPDIAQRDIPRNATSVVYRVPAGGDEARILRERAAWLASLDRKYGFAR
ncbi:MAG: L,D-transpeptidase [Pseudolabrys sp.]